MTARTAYGLDTPRGTHWSNNAACGTPLVDPDWWFPPERSWGSDAARALHICLSHCPVRAGCDRDAVENPQGHPCVRGGRRWVHRNADVVQSGMEKPTSTAGCPYCTGEASC